MRSLQLTTVELSRMAHMLLGHAECLGCYAFSFDPQDSRYLRVRHQDRNPYGDCHLSEGNICEDITRLRSVTSVNKKDFGAYDLERLGALLIRVGATALEFTEDQPYFIKVEVDELFKMISAAIRFIEDKGFENIELHFKDLYYLKTWHEHRNETGAVPLGLGYINDDVDALRSSLSDPDASADVYGLERFGNVFMTIGALIA